MASASQAQKFVTLLFVIAQIGKQCYRGFLKTVVRSFHAVMNYITQHNQFHKHITEQIKLQFNIVSNKVQKYTKLIRKTKNLIVSQGLEFIKEKVQ